MRGDAYGYVWINGEESGVSEEREETETETAKLSEKRDEAGESNGRREVERE